MISTTSVAAGSAECSTSYWQRGCDDGKAGRAFTEPVKGGSQMKENRGYRKGYSWGLYVAYGLCPACMGSGEGVTVFNGYMDVATACGVCGGTGDSPPSRRKTTPPGMETPTP